MTWPLTTSATSLLPLSNLFLCFGLKIIFLCLNNGCPPSCLPIRQVVFVCHILAIEFSLITNSLPFKSVYGHRLWTLKPIFNFYIGTIKLISCLCIVFICCNINFMERKFLIHYHILGASIYWWCSVSQLYLTLRPMDKACQAPLSMGFFKQEYSIFSWRRSSWLRNPTCVSCIGRQFLYQWATWEARQCI